MRDTRTLRRLALEEAQQEFPDHLLPPRTWVDLNASQLDMELIFLSLEVLWAREAGKRKALVELLREISKAESEDPAREIEDARFLEERGIDNDKYLDETPNLTPEEKLLLAVLGKKQRSRFYFKVEALAKYLDEDRAAVFRKSVE